MTGHEPVPIVRAHAEVNHDGSWVNSYETGNGIVAEEQGVLKNAGTDNEAQSVSGQFSYTAPDGTVVKMSYVADENGFVPQGDHLPVAPPVPDAILKALAWIAAHPQKETVGVGAKRF